jgi:hypothetical protein
VRSARTNEATSLVPVIGCIYGCQHGGLLELVQMIPKHTKYHLESGNYFHNKHCRDCSESIGDLFVKSKNKGIFYYCHTDNKVADLCDDDLEQEATACACILCLTCYYKREATKKKLPENQRARRQDAVAKTKDIIPIIARDKPNDRIK